MPSRYFSLISGPCRFDPETYSSDRCLAGVWNGTDGTVRIHKVIARTPSYGVGLPTSNFSPLSVVSSSPGNYRIERCTAYTGGEAVTALKLDTDNASLAVEMALLPATVTPASPALVGTRIGSPLNNYTGNSGVVGFVANSGGARLSLTSSSSGSNALIGSVGYGDCGPIVLKQDQGISVRGDNQFGMGSHHIGVEAEILVGTESYRFSAVFVPNYVGEPLYVILNTGATDAKLISLKHVTVLTNLYPAAQAQGNALRLNRVLKPSVYTEVAPLQADTAEAIPSGLLLFKNAVTSGLAATARSERELFDNHDAGILASLTPRMISERSGQIGAFRTMSLAPHNKTFPLPHVKGQELWNDAFPPIIVPVNTGFGVNSHSAHQGSSNPYYQFFLNGISSFDVEIILSYEVPAATGGGATDFAFFG